MNADDIIYLVCGTPEANAILRSRSKELQFPLSEDDLADVKKLETKYDSEENCAGLAAPQIGISKRIIVFATPPDPNFKKFRPDWTDSMPKTIWVNPSYTGIEEAGFHEDYEGCFSVGGLAGSVSRLKKIAYSAHDIHGALHEGHAEGYLARIIQHEVDHLDGILFLDKAVPESVMSIDEYRQKRSEALAAEERPAS